MLDQLKIVATFLSALVAGNATFFVTVRGVKYRVNLTLNGVSNAPHLNALTTLANAVIALVLAGGSSSTVKVGANEWAVTVTVA